VPGGIQGLDRYAYVKNSPMRYIDPTGHTSVCVGANVDPECNGGSDKWTPPSGAMFWQVNAKLRFGIILSNEDKDWDEANAKLAYDSLVNINESLNGKLKSIVGGATFKLAEYVATKDNCPNGGCTYSGWTAGTTVTFYTMGNAAIRQMNIYHEFGHLIDSLPGKMYDVFTEALKNEGSPNYIGSNGYLNPSALNSDYITNDPNYASVQALQASKNTPAEQWADIFANYIAGNIKLNTSQGRDMNDFVIDVLAPYIGTP